jgi:hypothetical protein
MKRYALLTNVLVLLLVLNSYAQKQESTPINVLRMVKYIAPLGLIFQ